MSWSMQAEGTAAGCKRSLSEMRVSGTPSAEEVALFEWAREALYKALDSAYVSSDERALVICKCSASGHGPQLSGLGFSYTIAWKE